MTRRILFVIGLILSIATAACLSTVPEGCAAESGYEEELEAHKKAIEAAADDREKALLHKKRGDIYVAKKDFRSASEEFLKALSLDRRFTGQEKLRMALVISWGGRLDESLAETEKILAEDPGNIEARVHRARVLSWSGRFGEAIAEADRVLKESPGNRDALLIKANSLKWKGDRKGAIALYRKLLQEEDDFDTRLGLAYAYLASGKRIEARRNRDLLTPRYDYQEKELKELSEAIDRSTRPNGDLRYSYYSDSDENILNRYSLSFGFWAGDWKTEVQYRHTDARDLTRNNRSEDLFIRTYSKVTDTLALGGGLSLNQAGDGESTNFLTGYLKADLDVGRGTVGIAAAKDVLFETAQLIENRIRVTHASGYVSQNLTDRVSVYVGYAYRDYSDDNHSTDLQAALRYTAYLKNPRTTVGYRFRYLNFGRQSGSGYFDPNDFFSHILFVSSSFEKERFYLYLEPFVGHQSFTRNAADEDDFVGGAYGTLGFKLSRKVTLELNGEGGNYAVGTAAGFNYYLIGLRVNAVF